MTNRLLPALSLLLLVLLSLNWFWQPAGGAMRWALQALPLLLTLPGQWRGHRRTLQWLGFILLFVMLVSILQSFNPQTNLRMLGAITTLLALVQFTLLLRHFKSTERKSQES